MKKLIFSAVLLVCSTFFAEAQNPIISPETVERYGRLAAKFMPDIKDKQMSQITLGELQNAEDILTLQPATCCMTMERRGNYYFLLAAFQAMIRKDAAFASQVELMSQIYCDNCGYPRLNLPPPDSQNYIVQTVTEYRNTYNRSAGFLIPPREELCQVLGRFCPRATASPTDAAAGARPYPPPANAPQPAASAESIPPSAITPRQSIMAKIARLDQERKDEETRYERLHYDLIGLFDIAAYDLSIRRNAYGIKARRLHTDSLGLQVQLDIFDLSQAAPLAACLKATLERYEKRHLNTFATSDTGVEVVLPPGQQESFNAIYQLLTEIGISEESIYLVAGADTGNIHLTANQFYKEELGRLQKRLANLTRDLRIYRLRLSQLND